MTPVKTGFIGVRKEQCSHSNTYLNYHPQNLKVKPEAGEDPSYFLPYRGKIPTRHLHTCIY